MRRLVTLVVAVLVAVVVSAFGGYYNYVTNSETPFDEVGIGLAKYMPGPVRTWGCGKLHDRFGNTLPPYGCQTDADPTQWK
jgi:hypothetical protein